MLLPAAPIPHQTSAVLGAGLCVPDCSLQGPRDGFKTGKDREGRQRLELTAASYAREQWAQQPLHQPSSELGLQHFLFSPDMRVGSEEPENLEQKQAGSTCSWVSAENTFPITHILRAGGVLSPGPQRSAPSSCPLGSNTPQGFRGIPTALCGLAFEPLSPGPQCSWPRAKQQ